MLSVDQFLRGRGHTVIRVHYSHRGEDRVGIVDMIEGGLPTGDGGYLDVDDITSGAIAKFRFEPLNERKDAESGYYGSFLDNVVVGYLPARELHSYNRFIEQVYFPMGNVKLEKYLFDGLAVLVGAYPKRFISDYDRLVEGHRLEIFAHRFSLWMYRFAIIGVPLICFLAIREFRRPKAAGGART